MVAPALQAQPQPAANALTLSPPVPAPVVPAGPPAPIAPVGATPFPVQPADPALPGVRDVSEFNPELSSATQEAIARLLQGGALPGLAARENLIRGETANQLRDARREIGARGAVRGGSAGSDVRALGRVRGDLFTRRLGALANAQDASARFGLSQTQAGIAGSAQQQSLQQQADQLGINRDLSLRGQDLQNLLASRQEVIQRFAIESQERVSENDLAFRREALEQQIIEQNRRFGLDTTQQEINEAIARAGLAIQRRAIGAQAAADRGRLELGGREADRLDLSLQFQMQQQSLQNSINLGQLPGFPPGTDISGLPPEALQEIISNLPAQVTGGPINVQEFGAF